MPNLTTITKRHDYPYPVPEPVVPFEIVKTSFPKFQKEKGLLLAYLSFQVTEEERKQAETFLNHIIPTGDSNTLSQARLETLRATMRNFISYEKWVSFLKSPNEFNKRASCLISQVVKSTIREMNDLDEYLRIDETGVTKEWSISAHIYDRLLEPNLFKLQRSRFFTAPYLGELKQFKSGLLIGTSAIGVLLMTAVFDVISPLFFIGFCCLPSILFLIKGLMLIQHALKLSLYDTVTPDVETSIKMNLQKALSCFIIALTMPLVWSMAFPIECVRFISRTICTAVELSKICVRNLQGPEADHRMILI
jgi:hypothetical protein